MNEGKIKQSIIDNHGKQYLHDNFDKIIIIALFVYKFGTIEMYDSEFLEKIKDHKLSRIKEELKKADLI